jgi:hypothetical protein
MVDRPFVNVFASCYNFKVLFIVHFTFAASLTQDLYTKVFTVMLPKTKSNDTVGATERKQIKYSYEMRNMTRDSNVCCDQTIQHIKYST